MKSSGAWAKIIGGIFILLAAAIGFLLPRFAIIWIGGIIWGIMLIANGIGQLCEGKSFFGFRRIWSLRRKQDEPEKELRDTTSHIVVSCSKCSHKFHAKRGRGITKVRCPSCKRQFITKT